MKFIDSVTFVSSFVLLWKSFSMVDAFPLSHRQQTVHIQLWSIPRQGFNNHHAHNIYESSDDKANDATSYSTQRSKLIPLSLRSPERILALPLLLWLISASPANAVGTVPLALWAYAHFVSIIVIFGCLVAEKTLVKAAMTVEEEELVVRLDLVYGLMVALLIISGLFRATDYGQGSEFYIHGELFWVKMILGGLWGGLSIFPSLTFYRRNFARKNGEVVPEVSQTLAGRLSQIINAEITAVLSIPLIATLMARGVGYWDDLPWPIGLGLAIFATVGSFFYYGKQALDWNDHRDESLT